MDQAKIKQLSSNDTSESQRKQLLRGRLLVVKLYTGRCGNLEDMSNSKAPISYRDFQSFDSVWRAKSDDVRQKLYHVFNHRMALPEYIVDYEYILEDNVSVHVKSVKLTSSDVTDGLTSWRRENIRGQRSRHTSDEQNRGKFTDRI